MPDIFPTLPTPEPVVAPDVPYTGLLVWLAFSPRIDGGIVDATASVRARPYRVLSLPDGSTIIDQAPEAYDRVVNIGSALEAAQTNPALAQVIAAIAGALQAYISGGA